MNKSLLIAALMMTTTAHAELKAITPTLQKISPAQIDQAIRVDEIEDTDWVTRKVTIVTLDHGGSTDVSPHYSVYLVYNSTAEIGNMSAAYLISDNVLSGLAVKRVAAGVYEISYSEYRDGVMLNVTKRIYASATFNDDRGQRIKCQYDFCDYKITASLATSETTTKR